MYQQQQQRRLEGVAGLLANQGRYGDSMLVHMNPVEVQGLASMSPTGSLTVNPQTGQPEAFLPFLIPLLGSMAGSAALTGLGATAAVAGGAAATAGLSSAAAGAIGSGLASWAATGDLKQGLVSGITGFGIGSALGGMGAAGKEGIEVGLEAGAEGLAGEIPVALNVEQQALADSFKDLGLQQASMSLPQAGADPLFRAQMRGMTSAPWAEGTFGERVGDMFSKEGIEALTSTQALIPAAVAEGYNAEMVAEEAMRRFDKAGERMSEAELARQGEAILANQFNPNLAPAPYDPGGTDYGAQYANAGGIVSLDPSDFRRRYNGLMELDRPTVRMQAGGGFPGGNIDLGDFGNMIGVGGYGNPIPASQQAALRDPYSISPGQLQDVYAQQGMPGFGPEIMYFSPEKGAIVNPFKDWVPDEIVLDEGGGDTPPPLTGLPELQRQLQAGEINLQEYLEALRNLGVGSQATTPAEGTTTGTTTAPAALAGSGLSAEEIANLYSQYMNYGSDFNIGNISPFQEGGKIQERPPSNPIKEGIGVWIKRQLEKKREEERRQGEPFTFEKWKAKAARQVEDLFKDDEEEEEKARWRGLPSSTGMQEGGETQVNAEADRLIDLATMAVLGELPEEEAGVVVQAFIDEFGEEAFSALRESVLEGIVPGSQKEGEIVGPGGGMDDQIMGMIGNQQPVAVSPGEYIVPADVVSGIGDGSTDAGVQELDGMLDRVRVGRTNTTQQPRPLRKGGVLPR